MPSSVTRFLKFQREQEGVLTPKLARDYLQRSRQSVLDAKGRKKLATMEISGVTYYGYKSLRVYKELLVARDNINREL